MANFPEGKNSAPPNRGRDERPPSPHVLKLALIGAAIILIIGLVLYLKARHAPPALHDELQIQSLPALQEARSIVANARVTAAQQVAA